MDVSFVFNVFSYGLAALIGYCTYKDYTAVAKNYQQKKFHTIFSLYTNGKALLDLKQPDNAITCINGIKALSMPLIVFFHTLQLVMFDTGYMSNDAAHIFKYRMLLTTAILPTETFFVLSGFLSVKCFLSNETAIIKLLKLFYHRYMRLTPTAAYFMLLLISINLNGLHGFFVYESRNCKVYWWSALLYTQTYINPYEMCIGPLWFTTVSWHLFLLSPVILLLLKWENRNIRYAIMGTLLAATHIPGFVVYNRVRELVQTIQSYLYIETVSRSYPYLFGMFYYYEFFKYKEVSQKTKLYLWLTTFLTLILTLTVAIDNPIPMEPVSLIFILTRILWPLALCWIIHACHMGCGGIINIILSFKYFIPLSSLSLGIFFLNDHTGHFVEPYLLNIFAQSTFAVKAFAVFLTTYAVATIFGSLLYLCIEIPFFKIAKLNIRS